MRFIPLLLFFLSLSAPRKAGAYTDSARVSLLTCSAGEALYSKFGHSAIRVHDPYDGTDIVYNYGLFDFNTPNFYLKFIRGKLPYQLGIQSFSDFLWEYQYEGREVQEMPLELGLEEKRQLLEFLAYNYRPENRKYPYDFFFDNCASRIRDVLENTAAMTYIPEDTVRPQKTFRQLLDEYIAQHPWIDFGIDLILGLPADRKASFRDEMFLPDYLAWNLEAGQTPRAPIAGETVLLLERIPPPASRSLLPPPFVFFSLLFLVFAIVSWKGAGWIRKSLDAAFFLALGLSGALFTFMWAGTDHDATHANLNLLWASPLAFGALIAVFRPKQRFWFKALAITTLIALLGFPFLPQQMNPAVIPIMLISLLRCGSYLTNSKALTPNLTLKSPI